MTVTRRVDVAVMGAGVEALAAGWFAVQSGATVAVVTGPPVAPAMSLTARLVASSLTPPGLRGWTHLATTFLRSPPVGFAATALSSPTSLIWIGSDGSRLDELAVRGHRDGGDVVRLSPEQVDGLGLLHGSVPTRNGGVHDLGAGRLDVTGLITAFGRGLRAGGTHLIADTEVQLGVRQGPTWILDLGRERIEASAIIATGPDADRVAQRCGVGRVGLRQRHVDAFQIYPDDPLPDHLTEGLAIVDLDTEMIVAVQDQTLVVSGLSDVEARSSRIDLATVQAMRDRVEQITGVRVDGEVSDHSHPVTLASDRRGVLGASSVPSFVWLSGLGAHATAWAGALGAIAAGMALGSVATDHEALAGLLTSLSPQRFRNSAP